MCHTESMCHWRALRYLGAHAVHPDAGSDGIAVPLVTSAHSPPANQEKRHRIADDCHNMHVLG